MEDENKEETAGSSLKNEVVHEMKDSLELNLHNYEALTPISFNILRKNQEKMISLLEKMTVTKSSSTKKIMKFSHSAVLSPVTIETEKLNAVHKIIRSSEYLLLSDDEKYAICSVCYGSKNPG